MVDDEVGAEDDEGLRLLELRDEVREEGRPAGADGHASPGAASGARAARESDVACASASVVAGVRRREAVRGGLERGCAPLSGVVEAGHPGDGEGDVERDLVVLGRGERDEGGAELRLLGVGDAPAGGRERGGGCG